MWRYPGEYMEPEKDENFDAKDPTLVAYSMIDEPRRREAAGEGLPRGQAQA